MWERGVFHAANEDFAGARFAPSFGERRSSGRKSGRAAVDRAQLARYRAAASSLLGSGGELFIFGRRGDGWDGG